MDIMKSRIELIAITIDDALDELAKEINQYQEAKERGLITDHEWYEVSIKQAKIHSYLTSMQSMVVATEKATRNDR